MSLSYESIGNHKFKDSTGKITKIAEAIREGFIIYDMNKHLPTQFPIHIEPEITDNGTKYIPDLQQKEYPIYDWPADIPKIPNYQPDTFPVIDSLELYKKTYTEFDRYLEASPIDIHTLTTMVAASYQIDRLAKIPYAIFYGPGRQIAAELFKRLAYRPLKSTVMTPYNMEQFLDKNEFGTLIDEEANANIETDTEKLAFYKAGNRGPESLVSRARGGGVTASSKHFNIFCMKIPTMGELIKDKEFLKICIPFYIKEPKTDFFNEDSSRSGDFLNEEYLANNDDIRLEQLHNKWLLWRIETTGGKSLQTRDTDTVFAPLISVTKIIDEKIAQYILKKKEQLQILLTGNNYTDYLKLDRSKNNLKLKIINAIHSCIVKQKLARPYKFDDSLQMKPLLIEIFYDDIWEELKSLILKEGGVELPTETGKSYLQSPNLNSTITHTNIGKIITDTFKAGTANISNKHARTFEEKELQRQIALYDFPLPQEQEEKKKEEENKFDLFG